MKCFVGGKRVLLCSGPANGCTIGPIHRRTKETIPPRLATEGLEFPPCPFSSGTARFSPWREYLALFSADLPPALDPTRGCRAVWSYHAVSSKDFGAAIGHCANITAAGVARWSGMISPIDLCLPSLSGYSRGRSVFCMGFRIPCWNFAPFIFFGRC